HIVHSPAWCQPAHGGSSKQCCPRGAGVTPAGAAALDAVHRQAASCAALMPGFLRTSMRRHIRPAILLAAMTAMTALPLRGEEAAAFESGPVLAAATLGSPALLAGRGYRVEAQVPVVGFMARFTLLTDDGPLIADSIELLEERAIEM